jgi:hypothetical protein
MAVVAGSCEFSSEKRANGCKEFFNTTKVKKIKSYYLGEIPFCQGQHAI